MEFDRPKKRCGVGWNVKLKKGREKRRQVNRFLTFSNGEWEKLLSIGGYQN
jgi:hypothetical protein